MVIKPDRGLLASTCNEAILKKSFAVGKSPKKQRLNYHKRNKTEPQIDPIQLNHEQKEDKIKDKLQNNNTDNDIFQSFLNSITILNEIQKHLELSAINNSAKMPQQPFKRSMIEKKYTPLYPTQNNSNKFYMKSMISSVPNSNINRIRFNSNTNSHINQKSPHNVLSELTKQKLLNDQVVSSNKRKQKYLELFDKINNSVGCIRECIMTKDSDDIIKEEIGNWDFSESGFTESLLKKCSKDTINYCDELLDEHSRINSPQLIITQSNNIKEHHKHISINDSIHPLKYNRVKNITTINSNVSTSGNNNPNSNKNERSIGPAPTSSTDNGNKDNLCIIY